MTDRNPAGRDAGLYAVCRTDLDRLHRWIERQGAGQWLTVLARRFTRGRLRYGPVMNETLLVASHQPAKVELWDPAKAWSAGQAAVFAVPQAAPESTAVRPWFGEILRTLGQGVLVRIDGQPRPQVYGTAATRSGSEALTQWRQTIEAQVAAIGEDAGEAARVDYALWTQGPRIFGALLAALRDDARFVQMDGRWFIRALAIQPSQPQLLALARRMLLDTRHPQTVDDLLHLLPAPVVDGEAGRLGLSLALSERPDLFANVAEGPRARWVLCHPPLGDPEGDYVARLAAYDPETWEVLCEPGDTLPWETVERLWALDLLRTVVSR